MANSAEFQLVKVIQKLEIFCDLSKEEALEAAGYALLDAADGDEAVEIFMDNYDRIDLGSSTSPCP
jgi:hypothetical protein